jgi:malate dehydrogenase (oxaloacetate-decarboxylating)(NADP+)
VPTSSSDSRRPGALKPEMLAKMAKNPLILALANPIPEIMPEVARRRPDAMVCTGRSDYPNQVNNVLCFPFIFRGALDVRRDGDQRGDEAAAAHAIAGWRMSPGSRLPDMGSRRSSGRSYHSQPVRPAADPAHRAGSGRAAMESGVAKRPITDFAPIRTAQPLRVPLGIRDEADHRPGAGRGKRIAFADGEDERVLRATQVILEDGIGRPILIGRPAVIEQRIKRFGLNLDRGAISRSSTPRTIRAIATTWRCSTRWSGVSGVTPDTARTIVRTNHHHRGAGGEARRRGCADLRAAGPVHQACPRHPLGDRAAGGVPGRLGAFDADHAARRVLPRRHLREPGPDADELVSLRCRRATTSSASTSRPRWRC